MQGAEKISFCWTQVWCVLRNPVKMHLRAERLLQRWFRGRGLAPLCLASGLRSWWGMINFKWCTALWIAGDSPFLPKPLLRTGKEGRVWGKVQVWHPGKLKVWLQSWCWHWSQLEPAALGAGLAQQGGCCENWACLAFSSIIVPCSQRCTRSDFCTWASQYVDLLAWTAHPHTLSHPTSLCERSTLAGNSDLLSCRNTHQQCQAQCDHFGWVWFIAVKEHSYSILKNHVML